MVTKFGYTWFVGKLAGSNKINSEIFHISVIVSLMESKVVSRTWTRPLVRSLLVWITCMKQAPTYANYSYVLCWRKSVILQDYHSVPTFYSAIVITHSALLIPHSAVLIVQPYYAGIFFQFHVLLKSPIDNICNNLEISLLCFLVLQYLVNNFLEQWKLIW